MLVGDGLYSAALTQKADPVAAVMTLGVLVIVATTIIAWRLPKVPEPLPEALRVRP